MMRHGWAMASGFGVMLLLSAVITPSGGFAEAANPALGNSRPSVAGRVVGAALRAVAGRTRLGLAGPLELPGRTSGYLTARAGALPAIYVVFVVDTTRPLGVNSPLINRYLSGEPDVATFAAMRLRQAQPPMGAPNDLTMLEQHNPLFTKLPVPVGASAYPALGYGIRGAVYRYEGTTLLEWGLGDWTVQISGGSVLREEHAAAPLVAYLQRHVLPPHPGIVAVHLTHPSGPLTTTAEADWMNGHVLNYVTDPTPSVGNAVATAAMAASWHVFRPA